MTFQRLILTFLVLVAESNLSHASGINSFSPLTTSNPIPDDKKAQFEFVISNTIAHFQDSAEKNGAKFKYVIEWDSSGYGAFTMRRDGGRIWEIMFYDGILRLPFTNDDLVVFIACHEIGHHLAGYPFKDNAWASAEGQADYFASHACLPRVWEHESSRNAEFRSKVKEPLKTSCEQVFTEQHRRDICYRTAVAMESMLLYEGYGRKKPLRLEDKDRSRVSQTLLGHPAPQCRIDTQVAGMFCELAFDYGYIPGHLNQGVNSSAAEQDSNRFICSETMSLARARTQSKFRSEITTARPSCWFASVRGSNG